MAADPSLEPYAAPRADLATDARPIAVLATPWRRLAASIVNQMLIGASLVAGGAVVASRSDGSLSLDNGPDAFVEALLSDPRALGQFLAFALMLMIVQLVLLWRSSTTIGKALFGLRIVRCDGRRAALWRLVLLRFLAILVAATLIDEVTLIGGTVLLWLVDPLMIFTRHHRTLRDRIADTIVVRTR
jgi:uncharacterized RDD family membrane protein YckC